MLLARYFCLFAQLPPKRQIIPFEKDDDDEILGSTRLMIRSITKKFTSEKNGAASIEKDCISLVSNIKVDTHEAVYYVFADPTSTIILSFEPGDQCISPGPRAKSPIALSQLRLLVGKTLSRNASQESTSGDLRELIDVISGFVDMLQRVQRRLHRRQESGSRIQLVNHPTTLSHEGTIVLTNLFLVSMLDYISFSKGSGLTPMCAGFYSCYERLCLSLKALCVGALPNSGAKIKLLLCQCISTASKIIPSLGFYYAGNTIVMPNENQIRHLASTVQILAFSLIAVRKLCGEQSCGATMLFWSACDALPCIIDMATTSLKGKASVSNQSKTSASIIFQALALTCPTPQELEDEIHRLQRMRSQEFVTEVNTGLSDVPTARGDGSSATHRTKDAEPVQPAAAPGFTESFSPFRVHYLLDGLQRVLRAGILDIGNSGSVTRLREEWLTCFARTLLFVLDQLPHPFASLNCSLSAKYSASASALIEFAPVLAEMFLEISMSFDFSSTREHDWIYTDLTKRLAIFVDRLKLKKKTPNKVVRKRSSLPSKGSADMTATPTAASVLRDIQASYGKGNLTLPLWQIKAAVTYVVDDAVDGQFKLENGTQRWYPARISCVNADGTYNLTYLDGDIHLNKSTTEIRQTKNWRLSSARSSKTSSECGGSLRDSFITINSDVMVQSIALSNSPFKGAARRKSNFKGAEITPRLLGVEEQSESHTPPIAHHLDATDDDSTCVLISGVSNLLPRIEEVTDLQVSFKATDSTDITVPSTFNDRIHGEAALDGSESVKSNFSDISVQSGDSGHSCQQTFAIPSVFDTPRQELKIDALPKMQFSNLEFSSAASHCSGMSLSAFLCRDNVSNEATEGETGEIDGDYDDDHSSNHPSPRNHNSDWLMQSPAVNSQRSKAGNKDHPIPQTPYSAHCNAPKPTPFGVSCDALLAASYEVYRAGHTAAGSPSSERLSLSGTSHILRPQRKCSSFSVSGIADRKDGGRMNAIEEATYSTSLRTFSIVSALLIQHCIVGKGNFLDINSCSTSDPEASRTSFLEMSGEQQNMDDPARKLSLPSASLPPLAQTSEFIYWKQERQINILFSVREFLEKITDTDRRKAIPFLTEISNFSMGASMRVLKLVTPSMFNSCLPSHMNRAKKIGDGGFGSVFRVTCDSSCSKCGNWESYRGRNPLDSLLTLSSRRDSLGDVTVADCAAECSSRRVKGTYSPLVRKDSGCSSSATRTTYAVKRIPRERSMHDSPLIYEVFNEITCLQLLAGNRGVCELIDFGVHGMEYWIVLEAGKMDLRAWRHAIPAISSMRTADEEASATRSVQTRQGPSFARTNSLSDFADAENEGSTCDDKSNKIYQQNEVCPLSLTSHNLAMCLALYADALLIVQSVHAVHVLHFDIKCNNFILHSEPDFDVMRRAHAKGVPSGFLFLADFGESVPSLHSSGPSGEPSSAGGEVSFTQRSVPGRGPSSLSRSRGTLPIQSPEMLSLTATGGVRPSFTVPQTQKKIPRGGADSSARSYDSGGSERGGGSGGKRQFPPPSAASDVWSLGCLLVELITGDYMMKNRPWTDLYVSLCMTKFKAPSMIDFRRALSPVNVTPGYVSLLEAVIGKCLTQNPSSRASIHELYEDVIMILNAEDDASQYTHPNLVAKTKMPSLVRLSSSSSDANDDVATKSTWNILNWNSCFTKLRPRSVDFRGGCSMMVTLLSANESFSQNYDPSVHTNATVRSCRDEDEVTQHWSSSSSSKPHLFTSYPYVDMSLISSQGSNSGEELKRRIDAVSTRIATCTLASCAKSLAMKSVTTSARTRGLFHIEITCCSIRQYHASGCKAYRRESLGGVEQLVLPFAETRGEVSGTPESSDLLCDQEVMRAVKHLLQKARTVLSADNPPSVLITIVPTQYVPSENDGGVKECDSATLAPQRTRRVSVKRKDGKEFRSFLDFDTSDTKEEKEHSEEEDAHCPLFNYSSVALTVASTIANSLTDHMIATSMSKGHSGSGTNSSAGSPSRRPRIDKSKSRAVLLNIDKTDRYQMKVRSSTHLPVSQRVVAPWLRKSLHPEFKEFLSQQLNSPTPTIVPTF